MKKIFALLALVLGVVSCQTEPEGLDVNVGGEQEVAICVSLPEATRANSAVGAFDNVDLENEFTIRYILQVYYNGQPSKERLVKYSDDMSVVFPVRLVPNRDYNFVVWADIVEDGDYADNYWSNEDGLHYNTTDLHNITLKPTWVAMDETRDAFTGYYNTADHNVKYSSTLPINITLKRPFAKLRVITTDMVELGNLNITPYKGTVTYTTKHRESFNACNGTYGEQTKEEVTLVYNIAQYDDNNVHNKVLFTDYFFANNDVVKFTMDINEANGALIKSNNFNTDINVQRNYLTTIAGNILTDGNNITVEVEDTFANYDENGDLINPDYEYATISGEAELLAAIKNGGEYIVISDIEVNGLSISAQAATRSGVTTTINLNGKTITLLEDIVIPEGNTLIINNDPVDDAGNDEGAIVSENGKAIINNGTLNIEGGEFGENTIVNNGKVNVNGGDVDDAITNGDNAIVGSFIYSAAELQTAVENAVAGTANEFTLAADIEGEVVVVIQKPNVQITIDGADHKFNGYFKVHSNSNHYATAAVTFKNINFETSTASVNFIEALENGAERYSTNITAENCTFTATGDAVDTAVGLQIKASKWAKAINCTATNLHSLVQAQSCDETVDVIGCTINGKNGVAFKQVKAAKVEGTTIVAREYGIRFDGNTDNYGIVVKNNNITAAQPFIVRRMTGKNNTITLEGVNTFTTDEYFKIVITNGSDDEAYVAPTGTYTLTGAEAYNVFPDYVNIATEAELKDAFALGIRNISLNANIALTEAWTPVGNAEKPWYGVFDGKDHKISGLTVEGVEYAAFISHTAANSTVKNLTLENVYLDSTKHAAGVVCVAEEGLTLENIEVSGNIVAASYAGGIMHNGANATIKNCENNANVTANRAGGIASWVTVGANIENVVNNGTITGGVGASGLAHGFAGTIKNAVNYGNVSSANVEPAAGIAGVQKAASSYEYCYNYGNVTSTYDNVNSSASGILGHNPGSASTIKYCANYGTITAEQSHAAGIAFSHYGQINASYCYNSGNVYGADSAGGIAPKPAFAAQDKAINYCLNAGVISSAGTTYQSSNKNVSCYYYNNDVLYNASDNKEVAANDALAVLNGGDDAEFFTLDNGIISVVIE
ncbi:MAG: hypothetical protein J6U69_08030 [Alistipes sp.]|nr:hypothetical protein [Alistipes sp.]